MYQVASTNASATPWVMMPQTQMAQPVLVAAQPAQPAQFILATQPVPPPTPDKPVEDPPAADPPPPSIEPACLCFFALVVSLLLMVVAGYWTASFLLSSDYVFSMEGYKSSSITWGFNNFQTKVIPAEFVPIGIKLIWWISLGAGALYGLLAVACQSRCNIILVCLWTLANAIFFTILTADEGQVWSNADTNLKNQWKTEISSNTFNFRGTGLSRTMYEYQCCGIDTGCTDFGTSTVWQNATAGSGCFASQCLTPCSGMIKRIKNILLIPFITTLIALILTVFMFLSALSMANQLARLTHCCSVESGEPVEGGDE